MGIGQENQMRSPSSDSYFPLVDVLRGMAALSVLTLHVIHHANWTTFPVTGPFSFLRHGDQGVDLFFVISGFVVLYNAFSLMDKNNGSFRSLFTIRRLARIVPLFYVTLISYLFLVDDNKILTCPTACQFNHIGSHLLFYHTYSADTFSSINGVNWTIAIEMQFYLLVLILAPWLAKTKASVMIGIAVMIAWLWRYNVYALADPQSDVLRNYHLFIHSAQLPGRIDEFAFGMALAICLRKRPPSRVPVKGVWLIALPLVSALFLYAANSGVLNPLPEWTRFTINNTLLAIAFSALVLASCLAGSKAAISLSAPLRYLGKISYGIYLWHLLVIMLLKGRDLDPLVFYAATLAGAITLASLSWYSFEFPINQLARHWKGTTDILIKRSRAEDAKVQTP